MAKTCMDAQEEVGTGAVGRSGSSRVTERDAQDCVADPRHQPFGEWDFHQRDVHLG